MLPAGSPLLSKEPLTCEMTVSKEESEGTTAHTRANLQSKFEKFLAEGGAGRSNTNELLAAIVRELLLSTKSSGEEKKRSGAK